MHQKVEAALHRQGFTVPEVRRLVRDELYLTGVVCVVAAALGVVSQRPLHFAAGALLVAINFYSLAKFSQKVVFFREKRQAVVGLLARFYSRFFLTALIVYVLVAHAGVSGVYLLAGAATLACSVLVLGGAQIMGRKAKEV